MNKICPYQSHTYIGYDEIKVENCPIQEYYTEETEVCCYDSNYKNCPIYNLQSKIDKAIEYIDYHDVIYNNGYINEKHKFDKSINPKELLDILKEDK